MADIKPIPNNPKFKDLTNRRFGRWIVIGFAGQRKNLSMWYCRCTCPLAAEKIVYGTSLLRGQSISCGCYQRENAKTKATTHGLSRTREFQSWRSARDRCFNPSNKNYRHYGGRGITMCDEWRDSPAQFVADMGPRPEGTELDRIDVNGNYEKSNCRWADDRTSSQNQRRAIIITHDGLTLPLKEWAARTGIRYGILLKRYHQGTDLFASVRAPGWPWPRLPKRSHP